MFRKGDLAGLAYRVWIDPSSSVPCASRARGGRWRQLFALLALGAVLLLWGAAIALADTHVPFNDSRLRTAVASQLTTQGQIPVGSDGTTITPADMETLTTLTAPAKGIVRLDGLQYAANLVSLDLGTNQIADLSPVGGLTNLLNVDVRWNKLDLTAGSPAMTSIAGLEGHGAHVDCRPQRVGLSAPAVSPITPNQGKTVTFTAALTPRGAALSGASKVLLYHLETKTVTKKIKGKTTRVSVRYWRLRTKLTMRGSTSGKLAVSWKPSYAGKWELRVAYAGSADYEPRSSSTRTFVAEDRRIEAAISWATARRGSHAWDHYCMRFASDAYESGARTTVRRYRSASEAANALRAAAHPGANAPRGALVFYDSSCGGVPLGHVGISLGNGTMISDFGSAGVCIKGIQCGLKYMGWAAPPLSPSVTDWDQPPRP
jgi:cell wall-associated NlpC family hydrolase